MKLWQKVFLVSLIFVIFAVDVTALIVLQSNFQILIDRERKQAVSRQEYLETIISGYIVNARLNKNKSYLSPESININLKNIYLDQYNVNDNDVTIVDQNLNVIRGEISGIFYKQKNFMKKVQENDNYLTLIQDYNEKTYLLTGSKLQLEMQDYYLYTTIDLTELYKQYHNQFIFVQIISIIFAAALSVLLLIIIIKLLSPLKTLNQSILEIANGNYHLRLKQKGSIELKELASNINIMTEAIEENSQKVHQLADGRKQFIDYLAHEMKTPLTSIMGFADILRVKRVVTEEQRRDYANIIMEETNRLQSLSTKLLELATADNAMLDLETISIHELLIDIKSSIGPLLQRKCIKLNIYYENITIKVDIALFKSLLYNLVENAIKASQEGSEIEIHAQMKNNLVEIIIQDYGIGMSEENIKKVTEPFYMIDKTRARQDGGAGLGLSLCAEIVKQHHGQLEIKSILGKGTCVKVVIGGEYYFEKE